VYAVYDPPYFLLVASLIASFAAGVAFDAVLKQSVQAWAKSRSSRSLTDLRGLPLFLPYLGICGGVCGFLGSGMEIFGFSAKAAYAISLPLTVFIGWLVWSQLGKVLIQLQEGGSRALDLDSF